jgi:sugar lactone lactonase YvrE
MFRDVDLFLDGLGFGEGPRWHHGRLWFSDFVARQVSSVDLTGELRVEAKLDDQPSGLGWLPDGRLLIVSMHQKTVLRREHDGGLTQHADLADVATGDANDMVVAEDGTAYVGNLGSDLVAGEPVREAKLARVRPDGQVSVGAEGLLVPNGSVITPDGSLLIVGESFAQRYTAFPIARDGSLGPGRIWADLGEGRKPDGCTLDAEGAIWFANCASTHVARVVEGGRITATTDVPDRPFACALGGEDGRTLFVLTCPTGPNGDHQPGSGRVWVTRVDVPHAGLP